jgi:hypothetical protein
MTRTHSSVFLRGNPFTFRIFWVLISLALLSANQLNAAANSWTADSSDPGAYGLGFARAHWASNTGQMLVFFGNSHNPTGNNSIRAYDPVAKQWEILWDNGFSNGGLQNRDNYFSFYNPRFGELWVWGGSGLETYQAKTGATQPAYRSGRFNPKTKTWVDKSFDEVGAFTALVAGMQGPPLNPSMAWCDSVDTGVIFGGATEGNATDSLFLIEPSATGATPYHWVTVSKSSVWPHARARAWNQGVCIGSSFYLYGGDYQDGATLQYIELNDLWRFDIPSRTWTQLPSGGQGGNQLVMTFDSLNNALVVFGGYNSKSVNVFDLANNRWSDMTATMQNVPTSRPFKRFNHVGVYVPTANRHIYTGGNFFNDDGTESTCTSCISPILDVYTLSDSGTLATPSAASGFTVISQSSSLDSVSTSSGMSALPPPSLTIAPANLSFSEVQVGNSSSPQILSVRAGDSAAVMISNISTTGEFSATHNCPQVLAPLASCIITAYFTPKGEGVRTGQVAISSNVTNSPTLVTALGIGSSAPLAVALLAQAPTAELPLRSWIARAFKTPNAPAAGFSGSGGGSKHLRLAYSQANGKIYFLGGDYSSNPGDGSFENGVWSYDIKTDSWVNDYPYCGIPGEIYASRPDEVGWVWDSRRQLFWALPGFFGLAQSGPGVCGTGPKVGTPTASITNFNPATNKWSIPNTPIEPTNPGEEYSKNGVYDPVTDSIWRVRYSGGSGTIWSVYNIAANRWETFNTPVATNGTYINDTHLDKEYLAIDPVGRHIYAIDPNHYRLFRLDMNTRQIQIMAQPPDFSGRPATLQDITVVAWDSVNTRLFYLRMPSLGGHPTLCIFDPSTNTWEVDSMFQPEGREVRGGSAIFDPNQNALMIIGGLNPSGDVDLTITHFFLYRYGNGDGQTVLPPTTPPPPPPAVVVTTPASTLKAVNLGVTGEDKVGQMNQTTPNGKADFHISVSGLRGTPTKITITSDTGGMWETPFNGRNWIIATQYDGQGNGHYWFEPYTSTKFHVKVTYADTSTDEADAANTAAAVTPPVASTLTASFVGVDQDMVGKTVIAQDGQPDFHIRLSGLRSNPTKVSVTSDTTGIWNFPFDGLHWIVGTFNYNSGSADIYFAQWASNKFKVQAGYADGTTDTAEVANQSLPEVKFTPASLAFDPQALGSPKTVKAVVLSNSGSAPLNIAAISAPGDFTQTSDCPPALAPGAQCVISVAFQPLVPGARSSTLTVTDNAPGSPHIVNLSGRASAITIDTKPPTITITSPTTSALLSKTVAVALSATDDSGVGKIELYKDGILVGTGNSNTFRYDWDTTKEANGNHTLIAMAYDLANNRATATVTANVQNTTTTGVRPSVLGKRF